MDENQELSITDNIQAPASAEPEKMLPQSEVDRIVKREKAQSAQRAQREAQEQHQRELEAINAQAQQQQQRNSTVSRDVDADALYQQLQERFNQDLQQRQVEQEMSRVAQNYLSKMQAGREAYTDFDEITQDFDPTAFPQLIYLVSGIDNAHDVVYELSRNPLKIAALDRLAEKNPRQAQAELLKLSRSIMDNKQATDDAQNQNVAAPLDRLQPSRISGSNDKMGIRDLRNQPWLKG